MLFHIVSSKTDEQFNACIKDIMDAFWPKEKYKKNTIERQLRNLKVKAADTEDDKISKVLHALNEVAETVGKDRLYNVYKNDLQRSDACELPFMDRFHMYFFKRKWDEPSDKPQNKTEDFLHLNPPNERENGSLENKSDGKNYSKNYGDYRHFVNVVASLARLIMYFRDKGRTQGLFEKHFDEFAARKSDAFFENICYASAPNIRTLKLMLSGFYHDIGKTVCGPRHGMEGSLIFGFHTSQAQNLLNKLVHHYSELSTDFTLQDLFDISNIIFNHDQYGTMGTGEDGYLRLAELIKEIDGYPVNERVKQSTAWKERFIFDLWLINVADILVSLPGEKRRYQVEGFNSLNYWTTEVHAHQRIEEFFHDRLETHKSSHQGSNLISDLILSYELLESTTQTKALSDREEIDRMIFSCSENHCGTRIQRLVRASLLGKASSPNDILKSRREYLEACAKEQGKDFIALVEREKSRLKKTVSQTVLDTIAVGSDDNSLATKKVSTSVKSADARSDLTSKIRKYVEANIFLHQLSDMTDAEIASSTSRSIQSIGNAEEFCRRLSWIGKMDYSLGFFSELATAALQQVASEIMEAKPPSHWIRQEDKNLSAEKDGVDFYYKVQAQLCMDNFISTVVQILNYILYREHNLDSLKNIEFSDATQRLTKEKQEKILSLEGPYRTNRSIQLILQTIYVY